MEDILGIYNRFARQIVLSLIGLEGQDKISRGKILIVGLGGIGSPLSIILARMGVSHLKLIDRDIVSITDLHRQFLYTPGDVDKPKAIVAKRRLEDENPGINVEAYPVNINFKILKKLAEDVDIIIDALDSMRYRYVVNRVALSLNKPYIYTAALATYGSVMTIFPYETPCLECIYRDIEDSYLPRCSTVGIHPSITNIIASIAANEAINILMDRKPNLYSKLLIFDLSKLSLSTIDLIRNPECRVCGVDVSEIPEDVDIPDTELLCARDGSGVYIMNVDEPKDIDLNKISNILRRMELRIIRPVEDAIKIVIEKDVELILLRSGVGIFKVYRPVSNPKEYSKYLRNKYIEILSLG